MPEHERDVDHPTVQVDVVSPVGLLSQRLAVVRKEDDQRILEPAVVVQVVHQTAELSVEVRHLAQVGVLLSLPEREFSVWLVGVVRSVVVDPCHHGGVVGACSSQVRDEGVGGRGIRRHECGFDAGREELPDDRKTKPADVRKNGQLTVDVGAGACEDRVR